MTRRLVLLGLVLVASAVLGVALGSVRLPFGDVLAALAGADEVSRVTATIVWQVRLPRVLTAMLGGAALALAGAELQTLFRNPLADPYILGVSSGASLGVAFVVLTAGSGTGALLTSGLGMSGDLMITAASSVGAALVLGLVLVAGRYAGSVVTLLLLGVMVGYLVSAGVNVLLAGAAPELIAAYTRWRFGSFQGVTWGNLRIMAPVVLGFVLIVLAQGKTFNALLLGERYAATMGMHVVRARTAIVATSSVLAGVVTAFCGPIQFLGIAVPHLARGVMGTSNHRAVLPACALIGAALAVLADVLAGLPGDGLLPLNAVTAMFGAPVVIWILLRRHRELLR